MGGNFGVTLGSPRMSATCQLSTLAVLAIAAASAASAYDGVCESREELAELPAGTWCAFADTELRSVEKLPSDYADYDGSTSAAYESYQRVVGVRAVTGAWNSGAFDTRRNRLLVSGGGHNDYGGNEVYAFSLETLTWQRLTDPTPFPNRHPESENDDGTPISRHTYGGQLYLPSQDGLFLFGGAPDHGPGACGVAGAWQLSLEQVEEDGYQPPDWRRMPDNDEPTTACDDVAVLDPFRGRVIYRTLSGWYGLDLASEEWSRINDAARGNRFMSMVLDPSRDLVVLVGGGQTTLRDLRDPTLSRVSRPITGATEIHERERPGLVFDRVSGYVIAWHGGTEVYAFDPGSANWTKVDASSQNAFDPGEVTTAGGVFGRFAYSEVDDIFLYVNSVNQDVRAYRLDRSGLESRPVAPVLSISQP